jgi:hypothetical protein
MYGVKRERILRVLLNHMDQPPTKYRVSKLSDVSTSWTIEYLKVLEDRGFVKGTKVRKPEALLEHWVSIAQRPPYHEFFHGSPTELLKNVDMEYALTTYMAENLLNHYLFPARTDIYILGTDLTKWKDRIIARGHFGKGNVRLLLADEHVFYKKRKVKSLWVASIPQVLVDLKKEGGPCEEAFDMMVSKYVHGKGDRGF